MNVKDEKEVTAEELNNILQELNCGLYILTPVLIEEETTIQVKNLKSSSLIDVVLKIEDQEENKKVRSILINKEIILVPLLPEKLKYKVTDGNNFYIWHLDGIEEYNEMLIYNGLYIMCYTIIDLKTNKDVKFISFSVN